MKNPFEYTKYLEDQRSGYESIGVALRENQNNIDYANLTEEQRELAGKLIADPSRFNSFTETKMLLEMAALKTNMWRNPQTLMVYFMGGSNAVIEKVISIAAEWSTHCGISFSRTHNVNDSHLRISFTNTGSWSYIGTDALLVSRNDATMNFQLLNIDINGTYFKGVVLHEFGHALGLVHEHQSPAVEMHWRKDYIYRVFAFAYQWDKEMVDRNLFAEFDKTHTMYTEVDTHSIMAYHVPPEFVEPGDPIFPQNQVLSVVDIAYIGSLYPKLLLS